MEKISLRFKQGSSDKVYNAILKEAGNGWVTNFAYGRYGKPLRTGTKTASPTSYEVAKRAFDKLVQEKKAKGYSEDGSGTPFKGSVVAPDRTGYLPQLLNPIEKEDLPEVLERFRHVALQTKHDGERRIVIWDGEKVIGSNRRGLAVAVPEITVKAIERLCEYTECSRLVLDGEDMGDYVIFFDILEHNNESLTSYSFAERASMLADLESDASEAGVGDAFSVDLPHYCTELSDIEKYVQICEQGNEEGVVLRDIQATYEVGRPNSGGPCLKLKFYATATCVVFMQHPTKRSITLTLQDPETGNWEPVGNCTIPPNYKIPEVLDLVEIKYLYAYRGGSLYQPQYKGVRNDIEPAAACMSQLKYKD